MRQLRYHRVPLPTGYGQPVLCHTHDKRPILSCLGSHCTRIILMPCLYIATYVISTRECYIHCSPIRALCALVDVSRRYNGPSRCN